MSFCWKLCWGLKMKWVAFWMKRKQTPRYNLSHCLHKCAASCSLSALSPCELQLLLRRSSTMRWASSLPEGDSDSTGLSTACRHDISGTQTLDRQENTAFKLSVLQFFNLNFNRWLYLMHSFFFIPCISAKRVSAPDRRAAALTSASLFETFSPSITSWKDWKVFDFCFVISKTSILWSFLLRWTPLYLVNQLLQVTSEH